MSMEPSLFLVGLSMVLIDGKGWPLSSPDAVIES